MADPRTQLNDMADLMLAVRVQRIHTKIVNGGLYYEHHIDQDINPKKLSDWIEWVLTHTNYTDKQIVTIYVRWAQALTPDEIRRNWMFYEPLLNVLLNARVYSECEAYLVQLRTHGM